jgi:hypothetical protein
MPDLVAHVIEEQTRDKSMHRIDSSQSRLRLAIGQKFIIRCP